LLSTEYRYTVKQKFRPENAFFLLKNPENRQALGALPLDSLASGGCGFAPDPL